MAEDLDLAASSPLSSVPEDFDASSPPPANEARTITLHSPISDSDSDEESVHHLVHKSPEDTTFTGPRTGSSPTSPASSAPRATSSEVGFAQSDIDAAIAASLSAHSSTVPAKRTRDAAGDGEVPTPRTKKAQRAPSGNARTAAAAARRRVMLCTSQKSPLTKVNLTKLLRLPEAWRALTHAQQKELAAMLPGDPEIGGTGAHDSVNVLAEALLSNDALRTDVREWHEGLQAGMEDPDWRDEAAEAMEKRAHGEIGSGKWWETVQEQEGSDSGAGTADGAVEAWWKDPILHLTH